MTGISCDHCGTPWDSMRDAMLCESICQQIITKGPFCIGQRIYHRHFRAVEGFYKGTFVIVRCGVDENNEIFYIATNQEGAEQIIPAPGCEFNKWVPYTFQHR